MYVTLTFHLVIFIQNDTHRRHEDSEVWTDVDWLSIGEDDHFLVFFSRSERWRQQLSCDRKHRKSNVVELVQAYPASGPDETWSKYVILISKRQPEKLVENVCENEEQTKLNKISTAFNDNMSTDRQTDWSKTEHKISEKKLIEQRVMRFKVSVKIITVETRTKS